jgi:predicted porin
MKKLLIASAALAMVAGTAQAQSSVTVYGVLDMSFTEVSNQTTAADGTSVNAKLKNSGNGDGALATSRLGFRGTEDLGGGTKANFQLEYDLVDVGTGGTGVGNGGVGGFGSRYAWVGLQDAKMGQLRLGQQETSIHSVMIQGSAGAGNNMAGAVYSAGASGISTNSASIRPYDVFVNRAITYISPNFSGVTFELQTADLTTTPNAVASAGNDRTSAKSNGGSLKYAAGKFAAGYGFNETKVDASAVNNDAGKRSSDVLSATYDFTVVKAFALRTNDKLVEVGQQVRKTTATEIGLTAPVGKVVFWGSMFDGDRDGVAGGTTLVDVAGNGTVSASSNAFTPGAVARANANASVSGYQLGARYDLSKRTAVYAIYGQQEIKSEVTNSAAKVESDGMAVGVRHSF